MAKKDARSLSQESKEALRRRGVAAVLSGMKQKQVARALGVSEYAMSLWMRAYREGGDEALSARKKGPAKGYGKKLSLRQERRVKGWIVGKCPEQLRLPFVLWTREAIRELVEERYGIRLGLSTVGNYLQAWGLTPQKPVRRAYERDPIAVEKWLRETYPVIVARAKSEGAEISWGDEMGLRSDHQTGTTYSPRGKTPVVAGTGQRFRTNMISAITNRGRLRFRVFTERFRGPVFVDFLKRLVRQVGRMVFLIVDGHPVHRSALVKSWLLENTDKIELFRLPGYSPELNPDEMLNNDVKANALGRRRPKDREEMVADIRAYLRSTQKHPDVVMNFFHEEHVRYAA